MPVGALVKVGHMDETEVNSVTTTERHLENCGHESTQ